MIPCKYFPRGLCRNGDGCPFLHERTTEADNPLRPHAPMFPTFDTRGMTSYTPALVPAPSQLFHQQQAAVPLDPRANVPCLFISRPGGCRNTDCPYSHAVGYREAEDPKGSDLVPKEEVDEDALENFTRNLAGATVYFNHVGNVEKISLPTDFSIACLTGLPPDCTQETVENVLRKLKLAITPDYVRTLKQNSNQSTMALVKVEHPHFAQRLSDKLKKRGSSIQVTSVPIDSGRTNARKIYISWHQSTRNAWLSFRSGTIARMVAERFTKGNYRVLGKRVKAIAEKTPIDVRSFSHDRDAWTVRLSDVPGKAKSKHVEAAIILLDEKPRQVGMSKSSYEASDTQVSVDVCSRLEEYGPLENFYMSWNQHGNRVKATAWFQDAADAKLACLLNDKQLDVLGKGKLTVTLIQVAKAKVFAPIYFASKTKIDQKSTTWKEQHLTLQTYHKPGQRFATVKVEGEDAKNVASARKSMDEIFRGEVLMEQDTTILWSSALNSNGSAYKKLRTVGKELGVVITRNKPKRQLHYHGPLDKLGETVRRISDVIKQESAYVDNTSVPTSSPQKDCPICFCEAENPIKTFCQHTYCLECFEDCCKAAAVSSDNSSFQVQCLGDGGTCTHIFTLQELRDHLSSSVFEEVLQSSFEDHIKRHLNDFRQCPTAECDYIYRCTTTSDTDLSTRTCANCREAFCTSCHAQHGGQTCAEFEDIQSGGYKAFEKVKKELNIKDCPKCMTPIEKISGCNHLVCGGCKAHICWVCMDVSPTHVLCYDHMNRVHGGIGTGVEHFAYE